MFLFESDPVKIMCCLRVYVTTKVDKILPPCDHQSSDYIDRTIVNIHSFMKNRSVCRLDGAQRIPYTIQENNRRTWSLWEFTFTLLLVLASYTGSLFLLHIRLATNNMTDYTEF